MGSVGDTSVLVTVLLLGWICSVMSRSEINDHSDEVCQWETFNASCPINSVILMKKAHYGRMKIGRCMSRDYYIGCYKDVLTEADDRCSGRRKCSITVPDPAMHELQPCPEDLGAYFEADYTCVEVQTETRESCHMLKPLQVDKRVAGYLASVVTMETGYGSSRCPWKLQVSEGQRINITLLDFGTKKNLMQKDTTFCPVYAKIREPKTLNRETTVCGDTERQKRVYTSISNEVQIFLEVTSAREYNQHFAFKYEAVGCATPTTPLGGWIQRDGDTLVIGCNKTTKKWHLVCQDTHWVGQYDNCTSATSWSVLGQVFPNDTGFPFGLVVSVIIGVVLGIVIGVALLGVVLFCRRRSLRMSRDEVAFTHPYGPPIGQEVGYGDGTVQKWVPGAHGAQYSSYAHIWEMKQSTGQNTDNRPPVQYSQETTNPAMSPREGALVRCQSQSRAREHIYESPKFDRKSSSESYADPPFYHEFEEDEPHPGVGGTSGQTQNLGHKPQQRYHMDDSRYSS